MVDRINLILKVKNLTSRQFAEEIGIQPSGMSHILSGRNNPSLDFVMKVIRRFPEIDINWLMFGKGEMYDSSHRNMANPAPPANPVPPMDVHPQIAANAPVLSAEPDKSLHKSIEPSEFAPDLFSAIDTPASVPAPPAPEPVQPPAPAKPVPRQAKIDIVDENRTDEHGKDGNAKEAILGRKRIVKVVILYDDHSFSEYYPSEQ